VAPDVSFSDFTLTTAGPDRANWSKRGGNEAEIAEARRRISRRVARRTRHRRISRGDHCYFGVNANFDFQLPKTHIVAKPKHSRKTRERVAR
jgi:hypothetical protein